MIKDVQTKSLVTHSDERAHFRELVRSTDPIFSEGFGQWSESLMYTGTIKAWHIHWQQVDWWYITEGVVKAVLCDLRHFIGLHSLETKEDWQDFIDTGLATNGRDAIAGWQELVHYEYLLGGLNDPYILKIPPGIAHGLKVLQGPAKLMYITSKIYNPDDEGRIPFDALGYDWDKREIW